MPAATPTFHRIRVRVRWRSCCPRPSGPRVADPVDPGLDGSGGAGPASADRAAGRGRAEQHGDRRARWARLRWRQRPRRSPQGPATGRFESVAAAPVSRGSQQRRTHRRNRLARTPGRLRSSYPQRGSFLSRAGAPVPPASRWRSSSSSPLRPAGGPLNAPTWSPWSAPVPGSTTASSSNGPTHQEVIIKPRDTPIRGS